MLKVMSFFFRQYYQKPNNSDETSCHSLSGVTHQFFRDFLALNHCWLVIVFWFEYCLLFFESFVLHHLVQHQETANFSHMAE